jgi:hypothetical protein
VLSHSTVPHAAGYRFIAPYIDVCREYYNSELCIAALNLIFYGPSMFITPDETAVIFQTWPASVSMRNVGHWAQMLTDGQLRFQVGRSNVDVALESMCLGSKCFVQQWACTQIDSSGKYILAYTWHA